MTTDGSERPPPATTGSEPADDSQAEFERLRALLVGRERAEITELRERLEASQLTPEAVAAHLPDAIALRAGRDDRLARALGPTLERSFSESVRRNPHQIADAIYPALGPAIRKAIGDAITSLVATINRALDESLSIRGLKWRWEAWRSGVPYGQIVMKHALIYRVEQVYLVHAETSLLLAHVTAPDLPQPDADVISGMLSAIRDFVQDSSRPRADGGLSYFVVGDVTWVVEAGPRAQLAAAVRGQPPPTLRERLQETLELVHFRFPDRLAEFDGDSSPFETAVPMLAECLDAEVDLGRRQRLGVVPWIAWGLAALLVLVLIAGVFLRQSRWNRAVGALKAEPGIVLLDAERGWRSWRFAGLRDPLAADPAAVLAAAGADTGRVSADWRPYLSVEPPLVLARARHALSPTASVVLRVAGDTLVAEGSAPTDWILRARERWGVIAGVARYRDVALTPEIPTVLRAAADSLAGVRVLFGAGSSDLSSVGRRALDEVARRWRALQDGVGAGWTVALDVVGRTDSTGSRELNRQLSDERAGRVAGTLEQLGIPAAALRPRGLGASEPLPAAAPEDRGRINRSVSFAIVLTRSTPLEESRP